MSEDVFELLNQIRGLDEDYLEPSDIGFKDYQQVKSEFYREIRRLESQGLVEPDRVVDHMVDRDYASVEEYLSRELEMKSDG